MDGTFAVQVAGPQRFWRGFGDDRFCWLLVLYVINKEPLQVLNVIRYNRNIKQRQSHKGLQTMNVSLCLDTDGQYSLKFGTVTKEEGATLYFALRAYRDQLVDSMIKEAQTQFDLDDYVESTKVLDLNDNVALGWEKSDTNYEDLMFLHEQLYKVNSLLFDLIENNSLNLSDWLGVD